MDGGYVHGALAPGHREPVRGAAPPHHLLRAHARGVAGLPRRRRRAGRPRDQPGAEVPASDRAGRRSGDGPRRRLHEPHLPRPARPRPLPRRARTRCSARRWQDFPPERTSIVIQEPLDFLGVNYYTRAVVEADAASRTPSAAAARARRATTTYTEMGWEVYAPAFTRHPRRGCTSATTRSRSTSPRTARPSTTRRRPRTAACETRSAWRTTASTSAPCTRAIEAGVDVRGYFAWSPARQLRVERGLRQALRARPRGLRDAGAHAEGQRPFLRRCDPHPRRVLDG